jgi:hypothetical protein
MEFEPYNTWMNLPQISIKESYKLNRGDTNLRGVPSLPLYEKQGTLCKNELLKSCSTRKLHDKPRMYSYHMLIDDMFFSRVFFLQSSVEVLGPHPVHNRAINDFTKDDM